MTVKFNDEFFIELGRSAPVVALVNQARDQIASEARRTAPVDSGDYRRGIVTGGKYQRRYVGLVLASDPKSLQVESVTGNLARAVRSVARKRRG